MSDATIQSTLQYPPESGVSPVQIPKSVTISSFTEKVDSTYLLDTGVGQDLDLGSVASAKALYMSSDQDIVVYINGAVTGFNIVANGYFILAGGASDITSISVDVSVDNTSIRLWAVE